MRIRPLICVLIWALASSMARADGAVVVVGGALRDDNHAVWQRIVDLAGGVGARFAVFATASREPEAAAASIVANLQLRGAVAEFIPVAPEIADIDSARAVRDPLWVERLSGASGVFFSGGAQARIVDTLQPGGQTTPVLDAIRALHRRGGVVAGTSSGAAVLSAVMFRDAPDVQAALREPLRDGIEVDRGLALLPPDVVVDQHFVKRGRLGRLLPLMASRGIALGLGVEEDSAAVVRGRDVEVIGARGVLVVDLNDARLYQEAGPFRLRGARLHWLEHGDRYDLTARLASSGKPDSSRIDASVLDDSDGAFHADILAAGVLPTAMQQLVDSGHRQVLGLSFRPGSGMGHEWRLYTAEDTQAWTGKYSDEGTVINLRLDLRPVRMAVPLYTPLVAP